MREDAKAILPIAPIKPLLHYCYMSVTADKNIDRSLGSMVSPTASLSFLTAYTWNILSKCIHRACI